ncbi:helix-turn-helix transcriptional regulator [uncultured Fusobacterium sp.]|uniref:helix-turn-helix domain-containing protein n=1 Tax=uncultured Fusobacterium sp. TaxID=159267 RepID=UPI002598493A|nr:helix-turn-helix transcriptional regulator [uncultured Fusobacterium sp.]
MLNPILVDFFENTFNYKKLKRSRMKRKISLEDASQRSGIPIATLQRYEDGITKKIPLEAVKKLCELYGTDYSSYYSWSMFPFMGSITGILFSFLNGINLTNSQFGATIGAIIGVSGYLISKKLYTDKKLSEDEIKNINKKILMNALTSDEKKEFKKYKQLSETMLDTKEILDEEEQEEIENMLLIVYFTHKIRKKVKYQKINLDEVETIDILEENLQKEEKHGNN